MTNRLQAAAVDVDSRSSHSETSPTVDTARQTILRLLAERKPGHTICPSEAARAMCGDADFRPLMRIVREASVALVQSGGIEVTQRGEPIDPLTAKGPVRLRATRTNH